ncbi:leucyl aminopeptidase [Marinihelvus fidelis]|uniref:Probable cytosol aminopeptidase n=1 Tax=Marinihelvus fidelis TaxID=2613842 RepID=A0A5N0TBR9_9GAMM|nr:leucyl aminopeptidase [Marinihelvus fidelis]KAA9130789.1 leucyl aminopeptidase [Marinihelvus fidelis]
MDMELKHQSPVEVSTECLVIGVFEGDTLEGPAQQVDSASGEMISRLLKSGDIKTDNGATTLLHDVPGIKASRVLVVGCGDGDKRNPIRFQAACRAAGVFLRDHAVTEAHVCLHELPIGALDTDWRLRHAALAIDLGNYRYVATKAPGKSAPKPLASTSFSGDDDLADALDQARGLAVGFRAARELGNLPPNICTPAYLARYATGIAERHDHCSIEVLKRKEMAELGMGALLAVGQGSANPPRLVVLRYNGAADDQAPYVLVGKGVTFDTGGISLKPRQGMEEMKYDMCGAAAVIGTFEAVAAMGLPVNLVTIVAAVENMPDGKSYRPGDVITSMAGKTIEILNTDAEGRLALCDALTYGERFEPAAIIDVATLTGACVVALGHHATAVMTRDDSLADELIEAGQYAADRGWRLPLWEDYDSQLKTPFADMKNVGGMPAGAITAGCFLGRFMRDQRWAHLDIAGAAWEGNGRDGASGRPVGLLTQYLIDRAG